MELAKLTIVNGTNHLFVSGNGTPSQNAAELQAAYNAAKLMTPNGLPLSAANRVAIIVAQAIFTFGVSKFTLNTEFIDFVSLTGNRSIFIDGIVVTANDVLIVGVKCGAGIQSLTTDYSADNRFEVASGLNKLVVKNCEGGNHSFAKQGVCSGTYYDCIGMKCSFGGGAASGEVAVASGTFIRCTVTTDRGFGGFLANFTGVAYDCNAGGAAFGMFGICSGTAYRCIAGTDSFGDYGTLTGKLFNCVKQVGTFIPVTGGGRTYYCIDGNGAPNNQ